MLTGDEIRERFLSFFEAKGHQRMPSASLVPSGDATLLFTSAGMVPFKPFFMGEQTPPSPCLTSSQKSFRTTDIDEVGDNTHLTLFEMLGNFSIGDYFKKTAISLAWEFVTSEEKGFGIEKARFFATVYLDDEDAFSEWTQNIGLPPSRIYRYGVDDNWWGPAGLEGPCGPCSELHYDFGFQNGCGQPLRDPNNGTDGCHPNHPCGRFIELWNLVFMQFYQDADGNRTLLPAPSVDTGMGLERAASILQNVSNIYETDLFQELIEKISVLTGNRYGRNEIHDYSLRVVAEHSRAAAFLISDGVVPGSEGRGYVLRRIIRRGIRHGLRLGLETNFVADVAGVAIDKFRLAYPDLDTNREFILRVISLEEERFRDALALGLPKVESLLEELGNSDDANAMEMLGRGSAELYDTFGIPPEFVQEIAQDNETIDYDQQSFQYYYDLGMEERKKTARAAHVVVGSMEIDQTYELIGNDCTDFVGYENFDRDTTITAILHEKVSTGHATAGQEVEVVLKETPFYAEGGGQVGDRGQIISANGTIQIIDTQSPAAGLIIHHGTISKGYVSVGDAVKAQVNVQTRMKTMRNHSGTHILHASLRSVLGPHVRQAGSLNDSDHLRFDYTHVSALSPTELRQIQTLSNQKIRENLHVTTEETTYAKAIAKGALAFFGDKYGDVVRVVAMTSSGVETPFSLEACGGTHISHTGNIGPLLILGDTGIGGGMRRIEAITGDVADSLFIDNQNLLHSISRKLETPVDGLETRLEGFLGELDALRKKVQELERNNLRVESQKILSQVQQIDGVNVIACATTASNIEAMREMGDWIKEKLSSVVLVLALNNNGNPMLISMVTQDLLGKGLHAGDIVKETSKILGGGGGGRAESAQAGGKNIDKLPEALDNVSEIVRRQLAS